MKQVRTVVFSSAALILGLLFIPSTAAAATQQLTSANYPEMGNGKGSRIMPLSQIGRVEFKEQMAELRIEGGGKKFKFRFESSEVPLAGAFTTALQARIQGS
jgi:hypothetical protein